MSITWVDAAGTVHESPRGSEEARGLCGGVGVVGIIAELKLQVGRGFRRGGLGRSQRFWGGLPWLAAAAARATDRQPARPRLPALPY